MTSCGRKSGFRWVVGVVLLWIGGSPLGAQPSETVKFSPAAGTFTDVMLVPLTGAAEGQVIRFVAASGRAAATAQVTANSPVYTEPIRVDSTTVIRAAVFLANGSTPGRATNGHYLK